MSKVETAEKTETVEKVAPIPFSFDPVKAKPKRKYRKGSKYDPILEGFLKSEHKLVKVEVPNKDANYIRTQLNKRIEATRKFSKIKVSVINNIAYLEK